MQDYITPLSEQTSHNEVLRTKMLRLMPPETIVLFRLSGLSYKDIADKVGIQKGIIYNIVRYYQRKCPVLYDGYEPIPIDQLREWLQSTDDLIIITARCVQKFKNNIPKTVEYYDKRGIAHTFEVMVVPHGIMSYASDYGINDRVLSLEKVEEYRRAGWSWRKISYHFDLKPYTVRMFVHNALFPPEMLYKYHLDGKSPEDIYNSKSDEEKEFYGLSLTVITSLTKRCLEGKPLKLKN